MRRLLMVVIGLVVAAWMLAPVSAQATGRAVIVVFRHGTDVEAKVKKNGVVPTHTYHAALRGFSATMTTTQLGRLKKDPDVVAIEDDEPVYATGSTKITHAFPLDEQVVPPGIQRIGTLDSTTAGIDGVDTRVDIDVAVLDTGIQSDHPDLNVAGGIGCTTNGHSWEDDNGHGTHVSGTIAALDNDIGVVGVAPGARLWAVKVLNKNGSGNASSILCGLDFVTAHADVIRVVNMSLGGKTRMLEPCATTKDTFHLAICAATDAGVTVVSVAGNSSDDSAGTAPGAYDEVIQVSAFADFDGLPGGLGSPGDCTTASPTDDGWASFSDFGPLVDIAAPGVCVMSTVLGGLYTRFSGTSMASPHVAGAAALYIAGHPSATPADVRAALLASAEPGPIPGDPDTYPEGIVHVASF